MPSSWRRGRERDSAPITEQWPKPVLPIDGRPVLAVLLRELAAAGLRRVWLVTGHLAEQVERLAGDGSAFGLELSFVRQPGVLGSADAVRAALDDGGDAAGARDGGGHGLPPRRRRPLRWPSSASQAQPGPWPFARIRLRGRAARPSAADGARIESLRDDDPENPWSAAPLWAVGPRCRERICLDDPPYELENAFQSAIDEGETVISVEIGKTRDLTYPVDLVEENFPYLRST